MLSTATDCHVTWCQYHETFIFVTDVPDEIVCSRQAFSGGPFRVGSLLTLRYYALKRLTRNKHSCLLPGIHGDEEIKVK
jgi:hypothetical protein